MDAECILKAFEGVFTCAEEILLHYIWLLVLIQNICSMHENVTTQKASNTLPPYNKYHAD